MATFDAVTTHRAACQLPVKLKTAVSYLYYVLDLELDLELI
jgi:hypothetical protein